MDVDPVDVATAQPAEEAATLLRAIADRQLTPQQSADLDAVLAELEQFVRTPGADRAILLGPVGDLKILELTASNEAPVSKAASKAQRDRAKRLVVELAPPEGRSLLRRRR